MSMPDEAKSLIAQAISHIAFSIHCNVPEGGLIRMTEQIERELEAAGYVVVHGSQLGFPAPEGPNP